MTIFLDDQHSHQQVIPPNIPSPTKYKAKIDYVSPVVNRDLFESHDHCFLGISLENSNFREEKLEAMLIWISRRFQNCTVLIGDSIHRLTLESIGKIHPDEALFKAINIGKKFVKKNQYLFDKYSRFTNFNLLTCQEVQTWEDYLAHYESLHQLFHKNINFRLSVESFGKSYHQKKVGSLPPDELDKKIHISSRYFLEEFAIFSCLKNRGINVMVYPGSFSTLSEISDGLHHDAPDELKSLTVVSLHLKGRKK